MFSAVTADGKLIQLAGSYSKEKAAELRKKRWFCPVCKSELDIKLGREKLPHFAHKKSRLCPGESEPESEYHLEGKRQLFLWLKTQGCSVSLEPYLTSAGQRPDLTAEDGEERLAFEFQCANLSADSLKSRTAGLKNAGYRPVWIIGAKRLKRLAAQFFRLSAFHWQFFEVHSFSSLLFYCPDARSFYRLHSITPFYTGYSYACLTAIPLHKANLKDICHPEGRHSVRLPSWGRAVAGFRNKSGRFLSEDAGLIRRLFYERHQVAFPFLPSEVFIPVSAGFVFASPVFVWQGHLYLRLAELSKKGAPIRLSGMVHDLRQKIRGKEIRMRYGSQDSLIGMAVKQYADFLCLQDFLREIENEVYMPSSQWKRPQTAEELRRRDLLFFGE
ncbi:competence protein CoiA family protein [Bacillus velezensis]|uniref:competence protein CoiA family protein n=1 Tax=Bacillus amyloliquefaciens group TaxID=1938374 RepID=UPI0021554A71|nr:MULTISPECIES: competence protein CoiA family protein [Bacillus amyloliquefaciens group]MCR6617180.1 competence protein CoiA [Bacillus amyloliquefaciens]WBY46973.1 competence protein CoiA family protein [Bacillus velezensis]